MEAAVTYIQALQHSKELLKCVRECQIDDLTCMHNECTHKNCFWSIWTWFKHGKIQTRSLSKIIPECMVTVKGSDGQTTVIKLGAFWSHNASWELFEGAPFPRKVNSSFKVCISLGHCNSILSSLDWQTNVIALEALRSRSCNYRKYLKDSVRLWSGQSSVIASLTNRSGPKVMIDKANQLSKACKS
jgi:hypothetical protein